MRLATTLRRSLSSKTSAGFFELRSDCVLPGRLGAYLDEVQRTAEWRSRAWPGFLGMWKTELGGSVHQVHSLLHWNSYTERDEARGAVADLGDIAASHAESVANMTLPLPSLREQLSDSRSVIMNEASACLAAAGLPGALSYVPQSTANTDGTGVVATPVCYEMRTYQLRLGYSTVPEFLALFQGGLKDKLAADDSGASELCTLLFSDCGSLNVVVEIWRHQSLQGSMASREASRKANKWRAAINQIAELAQSFETTMLRPLPTSPWR
jgi:hypothetical protein